MENPAGVGYRGRPEDQGSRPGAAKPSTRHMCSGDIDTAARLDQDPRAGGFSSRRGRGPSRRTSRRPNRTKKRWPPGQRPCGQFRPVEGRGRPYAGDSRRVADISGLDRKSDDALWKRYAAARDLQSASRVPTSPNWTANARPLARSQRAPMQARRGTLGIKVGLPPGSRSRNLLTEWKASDRHPESRRRVVAPVPGRPGHLLRRQNADNAEQDAQFNPTPPPEGNSSRKRKIDTSQLAAARCYADHHRSGTRSAGAPRTDDRTREPAARRRRRSATPWIPCARWIPKPRPRPSNSVRAQSSSSSKRRRPKLRDAPGTPPGPRQLRAVASVGRCRGEGSQSADPASSRPRSSGRRRMTSDHRSDGRFTPSRVLLCRSFASRRRSFSTANCSAVRQTTLGPVECQRRHCDQPVSARCPAGMTDSAVCRDHTANMPAPPADPARATQANAQRRVSNASIEADSENQRQPGKTFDSNATPASAPLATDGNVDAAGCTRVRQDE